MELHTGKFALKVKNNKNYLVELKKIKKGSTKSYGDIAKRLKISPRYVGYVCGKNRHILIIPCHRVIRSDGTLGGYSATGGKEKKKKLLEQELN